MIAKLEWTQSNAQQNVEQFPGLQFTDHGGYLNSLAYSADPDEMLQFVVFHLDIHCLLKHAFLVYKVVLIPRGGSRISGKGVRMYKGMGVRFADIISVFLNIQ